MDSSPIAGLGDMSHPAAEMVMEASEERCENDGSGGIAGHDEPLRPNICAVVAGAAREYKTKG